jgi:hypothetical protein
MKKILGITAFAILLAAAYGFYLYQKPVGDLVDVPADIHIAPSRLLADFTADEAASNARYLDRIVELTGTIDRLEKGRDALAVYLDADDPMGYVSCSMDARVLPASHGLAEGKTVTLKGKCTGWLTDVVLTGCVLVENNSK